MGCSSIQLAIALAIAFYSCTAASCCMPCRVISDCHIILGPIVTFGDRYVDCHCRDNPHTKCDNRAIVTIVTR